MFKNKILIVNKFLYLRGGDCIHTIGLGKLLSEKGHKVAFFAMDFPENIYTEWNKYFASEVSFNKGIVSKFKSIARIFGLGNVKDHFLKLLDDFKPDIIHLNNIHSYLSPILAEVAYKRGIKVVWTMHDYKLLCPTYSCLINGNVCEACFNQKSNVIRKKCMKNSSLASIIAYIEAIVWNKNRLSKYVDFFICPSQFMANKMIQGGFDKNKIVVCCNFIDLYKKEIINLDLSFNREKSYCYVGRFSEEKGINILLEVASKLPYKLYLAGTGPLFQEMKNKYESHSIIFLGHQTSEEIVALMKKVTFSVVPSIWYENNPLTIIESLCCGTPVLGSSIGGIPELIDKNTGLVFEVNNKSDLISKINNMFDDVAFDNQFILESSQMKYSDDIYYKRLIKIYKSCGNL